MLFKVGNEIVDTDVTPVGLIFVDKDEAKVVANILSNIKNGNTELPIDRNGNWWFMCPSEWTFEQRDMWSILTDEQKQLLENRHRVTGVLKYEL